MNEVERAKEIIASTEWFGDLRVNMTTVIGAGRVLVNRIEELEAVPCKGTPTRPDKTHKPNTISVVAK